MTDQEILSILKTLNLKGDMDKDTLMVTFTVHEYDHKTNPQVFQLYFHKGRIESKESFVNDLFYRAICEGMVIKKEEISKVLGFRIYK